MEHDIGCKIKAARIEKKLTQVRLRGSALYAQVHLLKNSFHF